MTGQELYLLAPDDHGPWEELPCSYQQGWCNVANQINHEHATRAVEVCNKPDTIAHALVDWLSRARPQARGSIAEALRAVADGMELDAPDTERPDV